MDIGLLKQDVIRVWFKFKDDIEVLIEYLTPEAGEEIAKGCKKKTWIKHQPVEIVDQKKLGRALAAAAVKDWRGMTMDGESFSFSPENLDFLLRKWADFVNFVDSTCTELEQFQQDEDDETEKK